MLRYGALGLPLAFLSLPLVVVLPSHYATHFGTPLAALGALLLATRLADAALDPWIGRLADRWLAAGGVHAWRRAAMAAVVLAGAFTALFFPPAAVLANPAATLAWLSCGLVAAYGAYSVLAIVHQAWGTRLGGDAHGRARIVASREGPALVGVVLASVLPPLAGAGATTAVLAALLVLAIALLHGAPRPVEGILPRPATSAEAAWGLPWRNGHFRALMAVFLVNGMASAIPATLVLFFVRDRLQAPPAWEAAFLAAYFLAAVAAVPLWLRLVRRLGLRRTWLVGMLLAMVAFSPVPLLAAGDHAAFLAICIASGTALGADLTVPGALLTGIVRRAGHGDRHEGIYAGWWAAASKLNLALAAAAVLPLLAAGGYTPGSRDIGALTLLAWSYGVLPGTLKLAAAALLWACWPDSPEHDE